MSPSASVNRVHERRGSNLLVLVGSVNAGGWCEEEEEDIIIIAAQTMDEIFVLGWLGATLA